LFASKSPVHCVNRKEEEENLRNFFFFIIRILQGGGKWHPGNMVLGYLLQRSAAYVRNIAINWLNEQKKKQAKQNKRNEMSYLPESWS